MKQIVFIYLLVISSLAFGQKLEVELIESILSKKELREYINNSLGSDLDFVLKDVSGSKYRFTQSEESSPNEVELKLDKVVTRQTNKYKLRLGVQDIVITSTLKGDEIGYRVMKVFARRKNEDGKKSFLYIVDY